MATILVVDDEIGIRELLSEILSDEGHEVLLADNAAAARVDYAERMIDLVLLDIWMPDTDGMSLLREWASAKSLRSPVIMMSGHASIDTALEAQNLGAAGFLEKPITLHKLLGTVDKILRKWTEQKQLLSEQLQTISTIAAPLTGLIVPKNTTLNSTINNINNINNIKNTNNINNEENINNIKTLLNNIKKTELPIEPPIETPIEDLPINLDIQSIESANKIIDNINNNNININNNNSAETLLTMDTLGNMPPKFPMVFATEFGGMCEAALLAAANPLPILSDWHQSLSQTKLDTNLRDFRESVERVYFNYILEREHWSMTRVAEAAGLERTHLYRKLKQLKIELPRKSKHNTNSV